MKKLQFTALLFELFGISRLQAQMTTSTYKLINGQSCDVTVAYRVTDCTTGLCSSGSQVIMPGLSIVVPCGNPGDDIYVVVTQMNYMNVGGGGTCDVSTPGGCFGFPSTDSVPLTAAEAAQLNAAGCGSPTGNYSLVSTGIFTKVGY